MEAITDVRRGFMSFLMIQDCFHPVGVIKHSNCKEGHLAFFRIFLLAWHCHIQHFANVSYTPVSRAKSHKITP